MANKVQSSEYFIQKGDIIRILHYGTFAPSTHNTQPWLFKIIGNVCNIYIDPKLTLREADPDGRNLYISIGCLLENIHVAAEYFGFEIATNYFNTRNDNLVTTVSFSKIDKKVNQNIEKLFDAIPGRHTYRGMFNRYDIDKKVLEQVKHINRIPSVDYFMFDDEESIKRLAHITHDSLIRVANNKSFRVELAQWMNSSFSHKKEGMPGYAYGFPPLISLITPTLMKILNPSKMMAKKTTSTIESASIACVVTADKDTFESWIDTGRMIERIMLFFYAHNMKVSISVAAIQDKQGYKELSKFVPKGKRPQFFLCAGYSDTSRKPTPRHLIEEKII